MLSNSSTFLALKKATNDDSNSRVVFAKFVNMWNSSAFRNDLCKKNVGRNTWGDDFATAILQ